MYKWFRRHKSIVHCFLFTDFRKWHSRMEAYFRLSCWTLKMWLWGNLEEWIRYQKLCPRVCSGCIALHVCNHVIGSSARLPHLCTESHRPVIDRIQWTPRSRVRELTPGPCPQNSAVSTAHDFSVSQHLDNLLKFYLLILLCDFE